MINDLTDTEKALLTATRAQSNYHDENPDVGMGPWPFMILDEVCVSAGITLDKDRYDLVLAEFVSNTPEDHGFMNPPAGSN